MPAFDRLTLGTARLLLRPLREADAPALFAIFSDPLVMRYWSTPPWTSAASAQDMIARDQKTMPTGEHLRLGIERVDNEELIGTCTLYELNVQCRRAGIGYVLGARHWGRGYMNEALLALLHYGFADLDLNRVEADIDPKNAASARILERLGFTQEGFLRERWIVDGVKSDTALYGLLRGDCLARIPAT